MKAWHIYENLHLVGIRKVGKLNEIIKEWSTAYPLDKVKRLTKTHYRIGRVDMKLEDTKA